jgi:hypothetical protein
MLTFIIQYGCKLLTASNNMVAHACMRYAFLTGAGASHGAGELVPKPPPLGHDLFDELASRFPRSWGALPSQYASLLCRDFELGMQQIWERRLEWVQGLMIDMACYFSEFNPSGDKSDCYSQLVAAIAKGKWLERVAFATLNYECVLDVAASRAGLKIAYAATPPPKDNLMIWKLHGACNLLPSARVYNMRFDGKHIFNGPIEAADLPMVRKRYQIEGLAVPPVMCIYMPGKPTQTVPRLLRQIRQQWAERVKKVDVVAIIGVRPNLIEGYVWKPILDCQAQVWYVGGKEGDYRQLQDFVGDRLKYLAPGFNQAIDQIIAGLR